MDKDLKSVLELFSDGNGFGDPEARKNAENRLQIFVANSQAKTASRLNFLTLLLVVIGFLNIVILAFQVWSK